MTNTQHDYAKKLADPRWQRKRLEVMQTANWKCQICGDDKEELNVHHPDYSKGCEPWQYDNLQCVCKTCHTINHATKWKLLIHAKQVFEERESKLKQIEEYCNQRSEDHRKDPFNCEFRFWIEKGSWDNATNLLSKMLMLRLETTEKQKELREIFRTRLEEITSQIKLKETK